MGFFLVKILVTAVLVAIVSELSRRNNFLAALLASIPLVSVLALAWLYLETREPMKVAALAQSIFWLVLPSLAFFLALPQLLRRGMGVGPSMVVALLLTVACYGLLVFLLGRIGIRL